MDTIVSNVPARLDRLPWSRWHWMVVIALGITWLLDGLEMTLGGSLVGILKDQRTLGPHRHAESASARTAYLLGAVVGALFFGYATDRSGRKKLFFLTWRCISSRRRPPLSPGTSRAYAVFRAFTGAASAANMRPSTRPSTN